MRRATRPFSGHPDLCFISIHALHAESDQNKSDISQDSSISIHALHAESDDPPRGVAYRLLISIHALHAESDSKRLQKMFNLLFVMS